MEYERIHKVQTGVISPSKLRMKLIGPHHNRKKDGSNSSSARTSPSRVDDSEFVRNSLLNGGFDDEAPSLEVASEKGAGEVVLGHSQGEQASFQPNETFPRGNTEVSRVKMQQFSKGDSVNLSAIHPIKMHEDDNLDYDSNASSSSFEFHKGERSMQNHMARSFSRPMPSKWNDAEKWIMNRQIIQANYAKKNPLHNQANRLPATNMVRVVPEYGTYDHKPSTVRAADTKRVDFCQTASHTLEKFSFVPPGTHQAHGGNGMIDSCTQSKDLEEVIQTEVPCTKSSSENESVVPAIRSVCMRDMGTEMTPVASQEPSRTATPVGATTPLRSPTSSIPSTPRGRAPASTPMEQTGIDESQHPVENSKRDLSEQEIKEKTRREIVALGVQLGKMNIAAWASKDEQGKSTSSAQKNGDMEELERIEYEKRAAAWEEAEKSKHIARFKREEIKIQAWESRQKAKLEAEMRRTEAEVEQIRAQAQAKMVKKIAMSRQRSEEKRAAAEARKSRDAERTAAQAEYIRQTGQIPSSHFTCCGWL